MAFPKDAQPGETWRVRSGKRSALWMVLGEGELLDQARAQGYGDDVVICVGVYVEDAGSDIAPAELYAATKRTDPIFDSYAGDSWEKVS